VVGTVARFRLGDDRFVARILEPSIACFELAFPPPPLSFPIADARKMHGAPFVSRDARVSELPRRDDQDERRAAGALIRRLEIRWPKSVRRLTVLLLPDCDDDEPARPVTPLDQWLARRPTRLAFYSDPLYRTTGLPPIPLLDVQPAILRTDAPKRIDHA
jgi:hypothetical protein